MLLRVLATVVAVLATVAVLAGTFWPVSPLREIRAVFLQWAMVLGGFAFLLAFSNLLRANLKRLQRKGRGRMPSLIIVLFAVGTAALVSWEMFTVGGVGTWGQYVVDAILIPGESALLALTSVTLLLAGLRALRTRKTTGSLFFVLVAVLMLIQTLPYVGVVGNISAWIEGVLAIAGMRGLLMGVALGTLLVGMRTVFMTRPYVDE
jgi:hypothetical protein